MTEKNAISYSLFGANKPKHKDSFDFISYLRNLLTSVRMARLVWPNWEVVVNMDKATYEAYQELFDKLPITVLVHDEAPLTKAMLWRMKPVFDYNNYRRVICRDLDSPMTYREAQCVQEWIYSGMAAHAMTDSISHGIPMLGGMIGFDTLHFPSRTGYSHWADMFKSDAGKYDFNQKGMDQTFLNEKIYPHYADMDRPSIMQHYLLGVPNTFLPGWRNTIPNIPVEGVGEEMAESNDACCHMGQAGWQLDPTFKFFKKHQEMLGDILEAEKGWEDVAYWIKDGIFE